MKFCQLWMALLVLAMTSISHASLVLNDSFMKVSLSSTRDQLEARAFGPEDVPPQVPHFDAIVKAAYSVITANFDDQMNATAPGPIQDIGFQHIKIQDALFAAQALAHRDFKQATGQFKTLLKFQWPNGFMPNLIYGPSVGASLTWLPTNKTFYPGPAFWTKSSMNANHTTSGILVSPVLAEVAMRIFYLSPLDTSMSTPVYTHDAMDFLCQIFPPLYKFHSHLLTTRRSSNTSLLSMRHPWESISSVSPSWKSVLANVKHASDYSQVISRLGIPPATAEAFAKYSSVYYSDPHEAVKDIYNPMLYIASCFVEQNYDELKMNEKCASAFNVIDIEFNAMFLRSAEALADMARILYQPVTKLGFSCPLELPTKEDVVRLTQDAATMKMNLQRDLWDPVDTIFRTNHSFVTGLFPLFSTTLDENIQMGLMRHIIPTPNTFHFFCDLFPVSIYPCDATDVPSRPLQLIHNYLLYRGFIKNEMSGIARFLLHRTFALIPSLPHFNFVDIFSATSGDPLSSNSTISSTLAAAILLNMGLQDVTTPPSPDTPPIDRQGILIVMCIELVVAMGVAISCVVFSVYFVVKRPKEEIHSPIDLHNQSISNQPTSPVSPDKRHLEESLLSEDEEHDEYGSFLNPSHVRPAIGMWSSFKGFISSISPWG